MMMEKKAKPFLKWASGKTQLISDIEKSMPKDLIKSKFTYFEFFHFFWFFLTKGFSLQSLTQSAS